MDNRKDTYLEFMVKRKYGILQILAVIGLYILALIIGLFFIALLGMQFGMPALLAAFFGAWWLSMRFNVEFEYIYTNGELDVDRIMAKRIRKRLVTVDVGKFEICESVTAERFANYYKDPSIKVKLDASKGNNSYGRYYAVFNNKSGNRMLMLFSPTDKLLHKMKEKNPARINILIDSER